MPALAPVIKTVCGFDTGPSSTTEQRQLGIAVRAGGPTAPEVTTQICERCTTQAGSGQRLAGTAAQKLRHAPELALPVQVTRVRQQLAGAALAALELPAELHDALGVRALFTGQLSAELRDAVEHERVGRHETLSLP